MISHQSAIQSIKKGTYLFIKIESGGTDVLSKVGFLFPSSGKDPDAAAHGGAAAAGSRPQDRGAPDGQQQQEELPVLPQ